MGRMPDGMVNSRKENKIMLEKVKEIVAESLNVEESTLSETTSFKEDLGADSLDLFERSHLKSWSRSQQWVTL